MKMVIESGTKERGMEAGKVMQKLSSRIEKCIKQSDDDAKSS